MDPEHQTKNDKMELLFGESEPAFNNPNELLQFPPEVEEALAKLFPNMDPLESTSFNEMDYINQLFPNEQSLSNIDEVLSRMKLEIRNLDKDIREIVRGDADVGYEGELALTEAQSAIKELFGRIANIKDKAEKSEQMAKAITRDIKQLDTAKNNLTYSVTTLENLYMLVTSVEDLQLSIKENNYSEVEKFLLRIGSVSDNFQPFEDISQIHDLLRSVTLMQQELTEQIKKDFKEGVTTKGFKDGHKNKLSDACRVISLLNTELKDEVLAMFIELQICEYVMMFKESQENSWLDKIDRRFAWMRREIVNMEKILPEVFPQDWNVLERLCIKFCSVTKTDLEFQLKDRPSDIEVKLLLFAIKKTSEFEGLLAQRFSQSLEDGSKQDISPFMGMISRCFENHLEVFIDAQDKNLAELMEEFVTQTKQKDLAAKRNAGSVVFSSSGDLFVFYKKCLVQCLALSTGPPLLELCKVFKKYLRQYSNKILTNQLPKLPTQASGGMKLLLKETDIENFTKDEILLICGILSTADYCQQTALQLEEKLKEKIQINFSTNVKFEEELEVFNGVVLQCLQLLVGDGENAYSNAFQHMNKIQWGTIESVGDQSNFVVEIQNYIKNTIPIIRDCLSLNKFFNHYCHKYVQGFIPSFMFHMQKCKPITAIAAEQLMIDSLTLKTTLLEMPSYGLPVKKPSPSYQSIITKGFSKLDRILKVTMAPHDNSEVFILEYFKLVEDRDPAEFQKILEMKGLKRTEQNALLELYKVRISSTIQHQIGETSPPTAESKLKKLEKMVKLPF